jgi:UDP-N-acetylglucosamine 2-epimerase
MKLVDIVGARPQFIKVGPILRAIGKHNRECPDRAIAEIFVYTGCRSWEFEDNILLDPLEVCHGEERDGKDR